MPTGVPVKPQRRALTLICYFCCFMSPQLGIASSNLPTTLPSFRPDAVASLDSLVCSSNSDKERVKRLWQTGLYDAGLDLRILRRKKDSPALLQPTALRLAKSLAIKAGKSGYSASVCSPELAWIAALPAPEPLIIEHGSAAFPLKLAEQLCQKVAFSYAALKGGRSQPLEHRQGRSVVANLTPGFVSLSCVVRGQENAGPQLWYLALVPQQGSTEQLTELPIEHHLPDLNLLVGAEPEKDQLEAWINQRRKEAKLPALDFTQAHMHANAKLLAASNRLVHNHRLLQSVANSLAAHGIQALGEDRVAAGTLKELASLLWYSPEHRDLLLSKQADLGALSYTASPKGIFAVLFTAASSQVTAVKE